MRDPAFYVAAGQAAGGRKRSRTLGADKVEWSTGENSRRLISYRGPLSVCSPRLGGVVLCSPLSSNRPFGLTPSACSSGSLAGITANESGTVDRRVSDSLMANRCLGSRPGRAVRSGGNAWQRGRQACQRSPADPARRTSARSRASRLGAPSWLLSLAGNFGSNRTRVTSATVPRGPDWRGNQPGRPNGTIIGEARGGDYELYAVAQYGGGPKGRHRRHR
jgi:hypothetical protein